MKTKTSETKTTSAKGSLVGRGALIRQLVAEQIPLALFISTVREKFPVCGTSWCERQFKRANARFAARAAKAAPAAPAPAAPVETPKPKGKKKTAAKS